MTEGIMQSFGDVEVVFQVLKKTLKQQGYNHKSLAQKLGVSEAAIKKMFYSKRIHLSRLVEICSLINLSLSQFFLLIEKERHAEFRFTFEQEQFFSEHPSHYNFFRELFFHNKNLAQMKQIYGLKETSVKKYVHDLERIGVLELHPKDVIKFKYYGRLAWLERGPWMKKNYPKFTQIMTSEVINSLHSELNQISIGYCGLTKKSIQAFMDEIKVVETKYRDQGFIEHFSVKEEDRYPLTWNFQFLNADVYSHTNKIEELM